VLVVGTRKTKGLGSLGDINGVVPLPSVCRNTRQRQAPRCCRHAQMMGRCRALPCVAVGKNIFAECYTRQKVYQFFFFCNSCNSKQSTKFASSNQIHIALDHHKYRNVIQDWTKLRVNTSSQS
jgi:hypothetical protein